MASSSEAQLYTPKISSLFAEFSRSATSSGLTLFHVTAFWALPVRLTVAPSATFSGASVRLFTTTASAEPGTPILTRKPMFSV